MKNKKETTRKNTLIKTDESLDKYNKMNYVFYVCRHV